MATALRTLYRSEEAHHQIHSEGRESVSSAVDIVAVHGLQVSDPQSSTVLGTWTCPKTKKLWLRDLLPSYVPTARVLSYEYDASSADFFGDGPEQAETFLRAIQERAQTLISAIYSDRSLSHCTSRPIIFICHGLGGLIVKQALSIAESNRSTSSEHLYSIFLMTYGILFFGTPHDKIEVANWKALERDMKGGIKALNKIDWSSNIISLELISAQFQPISKRFRIFNFWEGRRTLGTKGYYIVKKASAAPEIQENQEKCGIDATHVDMVRFSDPESLSFKTVVEAIQRYAREAPVRIRPRKKAAIERRDTEIMREIEHAAVGYSYKRFHPESPASPVVSKLPEKKKLVNKFFHPPMPPVDDYVGRRNLLAKVAEAFLDDRMKLDGEGEGRPLKQRRFVVHGMFGSGKTEFACKFASDYQHRFWGVFTVNAQSEADISNSFSKIGKFGGLEATADAGRHFLSQAEDPWLLIVDNADAALEPSSVFPSGNRGCILITTRNSEFKVYGNCGIGHVELYGLEEDDALNLFLRKAGIPKPWDAFTVSTARKITEALGYLALALTFAGVSIFKRLCQLKDFLGFHHENRRKGWGEKQDLKGHHKMYALLDGALQHLEHRHTQEAKDAIEILSIIGFYKRSRIPVSIFTRAIELRQEKLQDSRVHPSTGFRGFFHSRSELPVQLPHFLREDSSSSNRSYRSGVYRIKNALRELVSLSFIKYDGQDETFSIHPLVHDWCQDRLDNISQSTIRTWAMLAVYTVAESIKLPSKTYKTTPEDEEFYTVALPHLQSALAALTTSTPTRSSLNIPLQLPDFSGYIGFIQSIFTALFAPGLIPTIKYKAEVCGKIGFIHLICGRFEGAVEYFQKVKNLLQITARTHEDNDKLDVVMLAMAGAYWGWDRVEDGIVLQKEVVARREKRFGPNHLETLKAKTQLGKSYWLHGQYNLALELQEDVHNQFRLLIGDCLDHEDIKGREHSPNRGKDIKRDGNEAMKIDKSEINEAAFAAMDNLGISLGSWQRYEESLEMHEQVLRWRQRQQDGDSVDMETIDTMRNAAMALLDLERYDEALKIMETVYSTRAKVRGKEHAYTLWALCDLAKIHLEKGELDLAEELLIGGIAAGKRSLGENHLGVLMGCGVLAKVYARSGRLKEGESLTLDTIRRLKEHRPNHPDLVYAYQKLGQLYERWGKQEEAAAAFEEALRVAEFRLTLEHPMALRVKERLSSLKKAMEDPEMKSLERPSGTLPVHARGNSISKSRRESHPTAPKDPRQGRPQAITADDEAQRFALPRRSIGTW